MKILNIHVNHSLFMVKIIVIMAFLVSMSIWSCNEDNTVYPNGGGNSNVPTVGFGVSGLLF